MPEFLMPFVRTWSSIKSFFGRRPPPAHFLFAPSYDAATVATSKWVLNWALEDVQVFTGNDARHHQAIMLIEELRAEPAMLIFVGHGKAAGLLTKPSLGKQGSPISGPTHGCLLDTEDIKPGWKGLQIVAWACEAGAYFGPSLTATKGCRFLGFNGPVNMVINHEPSTTLVWSPIMKGLIVRILERRAIESHDAEWLQNALMEVRARIKAGTIDTGLNNRWNTMFLKRAAKNAVVHV